MMLSLAAFATEPSTKAKDKDSCHVTSGPGDVVQKRGDVVIEAGRSVENVIALNGRVTLKKGAKAHSVLAVNGEAIIEKGAEVAESVITIGGPISVDPEATVHGSQIALTDGLSVKGSDGLAIQGNFSINGESLSQLILKQALKKVEGCVVVAEK